MTGEPVSIQSEIPVVVTVYWRPGCPFCTSLRRALRHLNIATCERDIWSDGAAASTVRSLNAGNETVPTVVIGEVAMTNPSAREVHRELYRQFPDLTSPPTTKRSATRAWFRRT